MVQQKVHKLTHWRWLIHIVEIVEMQPPWVAPINCTVGQLRWQRHCPSQSMATTSCPQASTDTIDRTPGGFRHQIYALINAPMLAFDWEKTMCNIPFTENIGTYEDGNVLPLPGPVTFLLATFHIPPQKADGLSLPLLDFC
jgi:hypothetical protein